MTWLNKWVRNNILHSVAIIMSIVLILFGYDRTIQSEVQLSEIPESNHYLFYRDNGLGNSAKPAVSIVVRPTPEVPKEILENEGFALRINFEVRGAKKDSSLSASKVADVLNTRNLGLEVKVAIAGLDFLPQDYIKLGISDSSARFIGIWSILATKPGTYIGVIYSRLYALPNSPRLQYEWPEEKPFAITVNARRKSFFERLNNFNTIIGIIIAMTVVISFYWKWKDRRNEEA